jgi:hypothetical protein
MIKYKFPLYNNLYIKKDIISFQFISDFTFLR